MLTVPPGATAFTPPWTVDAVAEQPGPTVPTMTLVGAAEALPAPMNSAPTQANAMSTAIRRMLGTPLWVGRGVRRLGDVRLRTVPTSTDGGLMLVSMRCGQVSPVSRPM